MRRRNHVTTAGAVALAVALHGVAAFVVSWQFEPRIARWAGPPPADAFAGEPIEPIEVIALAELLSPEEVDALSAQPLAPVDGPADVAAFGRGHPLPAAEVDLPGERAAQRGGGDEGGPTTWTGRDDLAELRQQSWNNPTHYQLPRRRTGDLRRSDEALARAPDKGFSDRTESRQRRARAGQIDAPPFAADGADATEAPPLDAQGDGAELAVGDPARERVTGAIEPAREQALVDQGALATDAPVRGPVQDDVDAAGASYELDPAPFDLARARAGGVDGTGVRGLRPGEGVAPRGLRDPGGSAALRATMERGIGPLATRAGRQDPYFRDMYARLDALVEYPKELALSLDQGEVVVRFTLLRDGRVQDVAIEKSSGFGEFDRQVTRAVTRAAPYGPVPDAIIQGRPQITVRAPYAFRNPWIR